MAITTFIPTIWEARLLENFHKASITGMITTPPTKIEGNTITFNKVGNVAIKDYTGAVTFDELTTSKVDIIMNQKKYWAFKVDDVDRVQAAGDLVDAHTREAAWGLAETNDKFVLKTMSANAGIKITGASNAAIAVTSANAYDLIVDMHTKLNTKKAPKADRFTIINSAYLGLLAKDPRFTEHYQVLESGLVEGGKINGYPVIVSEELYSAKAGELNIMAGCKSCTGYGKQLSETEAMRLEGSFADGLRGLEVYGSEVLQANGIATTLVSGVN